MQLVEHRVVSELEVAVTHGDDAIRDAIHDTIAATARLLGITLGGHVFHDGPATKGTEGRKEE